jgi:phage shock protein A
MDALDQDAPELLRALIEEVQSLREQTTALLEAMLR